MSSWRIRSEFADNKGRYTSWVLKSRSVAIVEGERGFVARTRAARMEQTLESPSGSSLPKASWRIVR